MAFVYIRMFALKDHTRIKANPIEWHDDAWTDNNNNKANNIQVNVKLAQMKYWKTRKIPQHETIEKQSVQTHVSLRYNDLVSIDPFVGLLRRNRLESDLHHVCLLKSVCSLSSELMIVRWFPPPSWEDYIAADQFRPRGSVTSEERLLWRTSTVWVWRKSRLAAVTIRVQVRYQCPHLTRNALFKVCLVRQINTIKRVKRFSIKKKKLYRSYINIRWQRALILKASAQYGSAFRILFKAASPVLFSTLPSGNVGMYQTLSQL